MNRLVPVLFLALLLAPMASSQSADYGDTIQMPDWDNQEEMIQGYVAPFIFAYVIIYFAVTMAFKFMMRNQQQTLVNNGPDASTEAMVMALAITAMLMVTPYWEFVQFATKLVGVVGVIGFVLIFMYKIRKMAP